VENASIENASTVQICSGGNRKYGNGKSDLDADMTDKLYNI